MAVNFGQRATEARRSSQGYNYSLSALESAWSHVASAKENLDSVGRRIENARNLDINDPSGEQRKHRMVRKYGKRKPGRVLIDPHPEIRYKNSDDVYSDDEIKIDENPTKTIQGHAKTQLISNQFVPKRIPLYEERDLLGLGDNIARDFDYEMDDPLVLQRPVTPKVPRLSPSGSGRALLSNIKDSGALERLKERIRQQKESQKSPDQHSFPKKLRHEEDDPVLTNEIKVEEPMKRKIAASSSAPTYKGFNLPEAKENIAQTSKVAGIQSKKLLAHQERKERVGKIQHKSALPSASQNQKKGAKKTVPKSPGKMQRIISQRKPVASITTTSWRVGQEAVKKVLEAMKEEKASKTKGRSDTGDQRREEASKPDVVAVVSDKESYSGHDHDNNQEGETETASKHSEVTFSQQPSDGLRTDSARSQDTYKGTLTPERDTESAKEKDFHDDDNGNVNSISKDLSKNDELPAEAKSMLAELQMDPSDEEAIPEKDDMIPTRDFQPSKSPKLKRTAKRKAPPLKQKHEDERTSKPKIRHYDQEEVQSYMAKQLAERKKKKWEEKKRQQQMKLEQENKLKELYLKQKTSLRSSLALRNKKIMGSTFTKQTDDKSKSSKERLQPETAMNQLKPTAESFSKESSERSEAPKVIRSPVSPQMDEAPKLSYDELNQSTRSENETQFKDSLEVDNDGEKMFGIKSVTINKPGRTSPIQPRTSTTEQQQRIEAAKSVEEEVRELLAKYKASKPIETRPSSSAKVEISSDPVKQSKADRIAAISATASSLRERLAAEANRLSSLRMIANREKPPGSVPVALSSFASTSEFRGVLPGVQNLDEHAKTNQELLEKEEAATKIQAAYRGHSIRQGLTWKLPSGKTFGATITEARQKPQETKTHREQLAAKAKPVSLSSYSSAFEADSDVSLFSNKTSTASLISEARKAETAKGKTSARPKFKSLQQSQTKGNKRDDDDSLREILNRSQGNKGDKYSIINIFTRRLKEANKQQLEEERAKLARMKSKEEKHRSRDDLYEQDFEEAEYDTSTSTIKSDVLDEEEKSTASKHSLAQSQSVSKALTTEVTEKEESDEEDPDKTLTLLPDEIPEDSPSIKVKSYHSGRDDSLHSTSDVISPPKSPASLTEGSFDYEKDPVMSSTMKNQPISHAERMALNEQDSSLTNTISVTDKFSPSTLERKLRAEVNQLETMDDALRQITDIERVRGVSIAQQETVSLAQILKARQLGYRQELEKLSNDAREQATRNANEVERAKEAALKIEENATKAIAEIRTEAADAITESRRRLEEAERNAARKVEEAADKVEKANKMTTDVAIESANRHANDIQTITANAASAAASSAVQAAMQIHREQLEQLRNEALKVSRSYSQSTFSTTSTRSSSGDRTLTNSVADTDKSKSDDHSYADDDFEELSPEKGSITEEIKSAKDESRSSFRKASRTPARTSSKTTTTTQSQDTVIKESISDSIGEELDESKRSVHSHPRSRIDDEVIGKHSTPVSDGKKLKGSIDDIFHQSDIEEQSFKIDDHLASSLTEDEIDDGFRNLLPVISHRRKSLDRDRRARREKLLSDNGTSSDDMKLTPRSVSKHGAQSPFASEDTFTQFTADMVKKYIQEEELRSKHQTALLKLREKALIEKARAEMAYLEMQKTSLKNKKADDLMPPLNKKQRGLWMKLQSEQNEIRRLKQAYKAASHERRFMLYQQKEIMRLKEETQKIWGKLGHDKAAKKEEKPKGTEEDENMDKSVSEASSIASADHSSIISEEITNKSSHIPSILSQSRKTQSHSKTKSSLTSKTTLSKKDSISSDSTAEVLEEIPSEQLQSPDSNQASFPTYGSASKSTRSLNGTPDSKLPDSKLDERDETESTADDISMTEHTQSSMVVDLKRLKKKASEEYLMKREKVLKDRRHQFESVLKNQKEMSDWQKRIELDERRLKSDIKRALEKTKRQAAKPPTSSSKASTEEASESSESTIKSQVNSASRTSSTKSILSKEKSSESDTSVAEEIKTASIETDIAEESNASGSPGINSGSPGIISGSPSIATAYSTPQKKSDSSVPEEYADDTFESPSATGSQTKKAPSQSESVIASAAVSPSKRRYSKDSDESKSEEEVSIADATSDASDVEKRIRQLEDELTKRRRDLDRIRKKREKDQLKKKEQRLKQELQAVESLIQQENKENVNHDKSSSESNSFIKGSVSPKIMSPKILQQATQHEQATNKRPKEGVSKTSTEARKSEQGQTAELKSNSELAKNIANAVIAQVKEKIERKGQDIEDLKERSLSEELSALRKISESAKASKSRESEAKSQESGVKSHDQKIRSVNKDDSKSDSLRSIQSLSKQTSISESRRSAEDSRRKSKSVSSESDRSESMSEVASRSYKSGSASTRPSRSILEELSKAKSSVSAKDEDRSVTEEYSQRDRSDSLLSISESIFSEKSTISEKSIEVEVKAKISGDRSVNEISEQKSERVSSVDDIYKDDFFESSSSARSVRDKDNRVKDTVSQKSTSKIGEELPEKNDRSIRDEAPASIKEKSTKSDSITIQSFSVTSEVSRSIAERFERERSSIALSQYEGFHINDRVIVDGTLRGTIRFIGKASFSPVAVAGVELDVPVGNTDGSFKGKRYFECAADYGLFSPIASLAHLGVREEKGARMGESGKGHVMVVSDKEERSVDDVDDIVSEQIEESIKSDIQDEISDKSLKSEKERSKKFDLKPASLKDASDREEASCARLILSKSKGDEVSPNSSRREEISSLKGPSKDEISYKDDFEEEHSSATDHEASYEDDFEDIDTKQEKSSVSAKPSSKELGKKESSVESISERLSIHTEISEEITPSKDEKPSEHDQIVAVSKDIVQPSSPLSLSELDSSDAEVIPHPPRVDLDQLADSLTESLLKKLLAESVEMTVRFIGSREEEVGDSKSRDVSVSGKEPSVSPRSKTALSEEDRRSAKHSLSMEDISEEIIENISEKSDDTIKRMSQRAVPDDYDLEVSEAFVTPTRSDVTIPNEAESVTPALERDTEMLERLRNDQNSRPGLVEEVMNRDDDDYEENDVEMKLSPSADHIAEREIKNVAQSLLLEAISQMTQIMKEKREKLSKNEPSVAEKSPDKLSKSEPSKAEKLPESYSRKDEKSLSEYVLGRGEVLSNVETISNDKPSLNAKSKDKQDNESLEHLKDMPALPSSKSDGVKTDFLPRVTKDLPASPPQAKSPTGLGLGEQKSAIDTDLLAAKLSELKRMDQEIDDLLGEDSDEDEPFAPIRNRNILQLDSDETDLIPPVRDFDFSEPVIYVPHTPTEVRNLVAESAKVVLTRLANGENYDDIIPEESFLRNQLDTVDGDFETSSKVLYKRMVFDVTRDLLKEAKEFKDFQTVAKQPWTRPTRRVFAKFIRQIHNLTGDELIESFQEHMCVCLGLKEGRPSLDVLKKRLPLNTAKKDYIDAILVEELREEEPQWVNYDEDEARVKDQLTEGILESLITDTVLVLNDIQTKRTL